MSKKIKRRQFLAGVAAAPAAGLAAAAMPTAAAAQPAPARPSIPPVPNDDRSLFDLPPQTIGKTGSDFMVDVLKSLNIDYIASWYGGMIPRGSRIWAKNAANGIGGAMRGPSRLPCPT